MSIRKRSIFVLLAALFVLRMLAAERRSPGCAGRPLLRWVASRNFKALRRSA
jgi:hypothetical protein